MNVKEDEVLLNILEGGDEEWLKEKIRL
jgi:hypothetical protein